MESASLPAVASECRQCCAFCDRLVQPVGCIEANCSYLYLYDDEQTGRRFMGCMRKVYRSEIDVGLLEEAQGTRGGYGGVKLTGRPISQCRVVVERAYDGTSEAFGCVNPGFFDPPVDDVAFDLRDRL